MENQQGFFSRKLRAGKRRTYFFDVRSTKQGDYFVTITESKRRFDRPGYDSHKIFLYKEDFTKFGEALQETLTHIKTELNPDFDYDAYDRETYQAQVEEDNNNSEDTKVSKPNLEKREAENKKVEEKEDVEKDVPIQFKPTPTLTKAPPKSIFKDKDVTPPSDDAMEW